MINGLLSLPCLPSTNRSADPETLDQLALRVVGNSERVLYCTKLQYIYADHLHDPFRLTHA